MTKDHSALSVATVPGAENLLRQVGIGVETVRILPLQGGNNRVYRVKDGADDYLLKQYVDLSSSHIGRLDREFSFLEVIWANGVLNVPEPLVKDEKNHLGLYRFIQGAKLKKGTVKKEHVDQALGFVLDINADRVRKAPGAATLPLASDACLSLEQHIRSIDSRVRQFIRMPATDNISRKAGLFIKKTLIPQWEKVKKRSVQPAKKMSELSREHQILSPSDFGFHNAVAGAQLFFIDFEYAGWDDPAKMVCDFFCQPEIPVPGRFMADFAAAVSDRTGADDQFQNKIDWLMPMYRVKWCGIILNDFLEGKSQRRKFAFFEQDRRPGQLEKAKIYATEHFLH